MVVNFELDGMPVIALNGGPAHQPTEAFSFFINCDSQDEVDRLWEALIADGGEESMCGWLKDRFGLSWQVIPTRLMELMGDPDPAKAQRVMGAMLQMRKIDVPTLERAHAGE
jgi:predicted 3-demethylubiquinone-9 3-methyltransferase (glyoxalase superfamily)